MKKLPDSGGTTAPGGRVLCVHETTRRHLRPLPKDQGYRAGPWMKYSRHPERTHLFTHDPPRPTRAERCLTSIAQAYAARLDRPGVRP